MMVRVAIVTFRSFLDLSCVTIARRVLLSMLLVMLLVHLLDGALRTLDQVAVA